MSSKERKFWLNYFYFPVFFLYPIINYLLLYFEVIDSSKVPALIGLYVFFIFVFPGLIAAACNSKRYEFKFNKDSNHDHD
ncbi:hypothetical protein [Moellerella wisconsensis]|uniref:hypothetical protein n=1 Tax=Moellerella wisconsensis TaxID=158849 RepID=UPI001F4EFD91|nr:hypothetical protein [Moellerella wisconsensis]UNH22805.1 hypothetical protein MNY68_07905 [Moellerella wisconsensis]UNH22819.1 hypothetical protein MNY68_07975 [Moellerella wisconsensis]UNH25602.1 hypothetical protein MNY68_07835 [Moellerella wisconsensis]